MKLHHWQRRSGAQLGFTSLGFGTAPLGNLFRAITDDDAQATLEAAWRTGCRYFDTAPLYGLGLSETRLNRFLRGKPRDEYLLSTKVGRVLEVCLPDQRTGIGKFFDTPSRRERYDYSYDGVMRSLEQSFERLGVDRIDILLGHDLDHFTHGAGRDDMIETFMSGGYRALVELRDQGVVRAIGAGINENEACQILAERGDFDLFLLAGRYTLLEQEALDTLLPLCVKRGIGIVLGGPYNSGILATGARQGATFDYNIASPKILDRVQRIETVCARHGVSLIEAALNFPLFHPAVVSVIPGGQSVEQVEGNRRMLDAIIPAGLWLDLKSAGLLREDAPTG